MRSNRNTILRSRGLLAALLCAVVVCHFSSPTAQAQESANALDETAFVPGFRVQQFSRRDGLPQDTVTSVAQTTDGYLWFGTFNGLARFDGVNFRTFNIGNSPSLKSNRILSLCADRNGGLWIGTEDAGVVRFAGGNFSALPNLHADDQGEIWTIIQDRAGAIWTTGRRIVCYQNGVGQLVDVGGDGGNYNCVSLFEDSRGTIWAGMVDGVVRLVNGSFESVPADLQGVDVPIRSIGESPDGTVWIGHNKAMYSLQGGRFVRARGGLTLDWIAPGLLDTEGRSFIGGHMGLYQFRRAPSQFTASDPLENYHRIPGMPDGGLRTISEDRERNIWVGTNAHGVFCLSNSPFVEINEPSLIEDLWSLYRGPEGLVLVIQQPNRVLTAHQDSLQSAKQTTQPPFKRIHTLFTDAADTIWAGTTNGLWESLTGGGYKRIDTLPTFSIAQDSKGVLWHGGKGVLSEWKKTGAVRHHLPNTDQPILSIAFSVENAVWLHTAHEVLKYENGQFKSYTTGEQLPEGTIRALHVTRTETLWASTYGSGLVRIRDGEVFVYDESCGLLDNSLGGILEDQRQRLWINSNRGVFCVNLSELNALAAGTLDRLQTRSMGTPEGNGAGACLTTTGHMWFPTIHGAVILKQDVSFNEVAPLVAIQEVSANGIALDPDALRAEPGEGRLSISYAGLSFRAPERVTFEYKLDGFDEDWIVAGPRRTAYYTNLSPGNYRFSMRAANDDGVWSAESEQILITLRPFFYQTAWFRTLVSLAALGLIFGLHRQRIDTVRARNRALEGELRERERAQEALAERRALEKELAESKRLETLGRLAGGVAHDFNNILCALIGHAELMKLSLESASTEEIREFADQMLLGGNRAADLTKQLLAFSRQQPVMPVVLAPDELLHELEPMLRRLIPKDIELHMQPAVEIGHVLIDSSQLEQVLVNLAVNARDAMPEGGHLTFEMSNCVLDEDYAHTHVDARQGPHVLIAVSDTGTGISEAIMPHIFEPFYTSKPADKGTGLGLASVHGILKQAGGHIIVNSESGHGTVFQLYLPRVYSERTEVLQDLPIEDSLRGTETVLICDDFDDARLVAQRVLQQFGYRTLVAAHPHDAIRIAEEFSEPIHLLVTDVVMPSMNGRQLANRIKQQREGMRVLYISGHTQDVVLHDGGVDEGIELLAKPFTPCELLRRTKTILNVAAKT